MSADLSPDHLVTIDNKASVAPTRQRDTGRTQSEMKICVVDLGLGNIGSVINALRRLGFHAQASADVNAIAAADRLILAGVGSFDAAMTLLHAKGLTEPLTRRVMVDRIPILGICLGMQLFGQRSEEGTADGLGWLPNSSRRFDSSAGERIPHIGWQRLDHLRPDALLDGISTDSHFYFVHSYHFANMSQDYVLATANHCGDFPAIVRQNNIVGTQFHPEKSHDAGHRLLRNFLLMGTP